ncbi:MAG: hypothetical protein LC777_05560 [Actinobacteria bacterium]|nr:hypothetical protein [Actinomycetota bacterium]
MRSGARPECGRHPGSRVQFFGRYGAPGRERQRFRCFSSDGPAHTFTESLPRQVAGHEDCRRIASARSRRIRVCKHRVAIAFPAREIARTLVGLGQGQTYVDGQRELWHMQAFTNATPASWREFFSGLPGAPPRIVCDAHSGMLEVIEERWPQTEVYLCECDVTPATWDDLAE